MRHKLKAAQIGKAKQPGWMNDGGGLYLVTSKSLTQSWVYRYRKHGRLNDVGLGGTSDVTLKSARDLADKARDAVKSGKDPRQALRGDPDAVTFEDCAKEYIDAQAPGWKSPKQKPQWESSLKTYAYKKIGHLPVSEVDTDNVLSVLTPIWHTKTETASRVRMRIENILAYAQVKGYRPKESFNPAIWQGHLSQTLPARSKVQKRKHFAALPFADIPQLYADLAAKTSLSAKALRLTLLTACRTGEIIGAQWSEIAGDVWTIPDERMKAGVAHRVPLSDPAMAVLSELDENHPYLFPALQMRGKSANPHISNIAMLKLLKTMRPGMTVHGLRSSFRDWAAEETHYQNHVVEMALAHTVGNAVEAAYRRGDLFKKRRDLMSDWADFCMGVGK